MSNYTIITNGFPMDDCDTLKKAIIMAKFRERKMAYDSIIEVYDNEEKRVVYIIRH